MNIKKSFLLLLIVLMESTVASSQGFAVVELFTSQGCSSCPPADDVLAQIADQYAGKEVYPLSFHVDYWNRLGWKDPYSKPEFSERQRWYRGKIGGGVYTPEMIINGKDGFVGSQRSNALYLVNEALNSDQSVKVYAEQKSSANGVIQIAYSISGFKTSQNIAVAVAKNHTENKVPAGENRGKTLEHVNVVEAFAEAKAMANGELSITTPEGYSKSEFKIIVFVQDSDTGDIKAAVKM